LRQAGCEWYELLCKIMHGLNFKRCRVEHVVFYKHKAGDTLFIAADVDDMTIARSSRDAIQRFKEGLS
jgi:Reverse transcriptase (RNA-dependent DNA polymerase)